METDKIYIGKYRYKKSRGKLVGGCIIACPDMDKFYIIEYFKDSITWKEITLSKVEELKRQLDAQAKSGALEKLKCDGPFNSFCYIADYISTPV